MLQTPSIANIQCNPEGLEHNIRSAYIIRIGGFGSVTLDLNNNILAISEKRKSLYDKIANNKDNKMCGSIFHN